MAGDILIVDDERDICQLMAETLEDEGYTTRQAHDGPGAMDAVRARCPSLVILDIWLGDSRFDGVKVLELLMQDYPHLPVVMMSGHGTIETAVETIKKGAYDFVEKPFKMDRLLVVAKRALEAAHLREENQDLKVRSGVEGNVLEEAVMTPSLKKEIKRLAPTSSRVFLRGEPGTGKSFIARIIHQYSTRTTGPYVTLNCAALAFEAQAPALFGKEENGSIKIGALERAHQGTLFLDEVGDLDSETQKGLLRALQEQSFTRVGGTQKVPVDVRVISSTSIDLKDAIAHSHFREDLYNRLCVSPVDVPSLRERMGDLPQLVEVFSQMTALSHGVSRLSFSKEALLALQTYNWPGNLSQLKNVVDWVYVTVSERGLPEEGVTPDMLPFDVTNQTPSLVHSEDTMARLISLPLREARQEFERDYLLAQVVRFSGNISHTANFVGMERSALHRKLKSLMIERRS
ncbi:MAG: sigma-54-dependent transcriptional regulator [Alphaproteobacteria bacterium]|jgi:two-component system nitrogen regulation response regulator NtrX|nr:sigma-54 dependent transcriptional regulator [Alphaproteobacteria bacterium]